MNLISDFQQARESGTLSWLTEPESWSFDKGVLRMTPAAKTDFFRSPEGKTVRDNACLLHTSVSGDFTAVAHVKAQLVGFGDAGALMIRESPENWAKICLERSPAGDLSIVTVITEGTSDDSNGELLESGECYIRITRKGSVFGMHHSLDGRNWRFTRTFTRNYEGDLMVGILAQAPFVGGCSVDFDLFEISDKPVSDYRSGE